MPQMALLCAIGIRENYLSTLGNVADRACGAKKTRVWDEEIGNTKRSTETQRY